MKKILLPILILTAGIFNTAQGQAKLKIGHVNSNEILQVVDGVKEADAQLKTYADQLEQQNQIMLQEYQTKMQQYQSQVDMMTDVVKEVKEKEIVDLEKRISEFQMTAQEKLAEKKEELYSPILKKAEDAIKEVAKENGYTYILDMSLGSVLYADEANDVTELVKKKLGVE